MSKTAKEIGLIVGGLAIAAVPGLGQLGLISIAGHTALLNAMLGIGISTALSGVGLALRQAPSAVGTSGTVAFNNGVSPRRVIYGQFQTAGVLTYASFPPSENQDVTKQYLHLVYTLAGHEISSFDAVVIDGHVYNFGGDINWDPPTNYWHVDPDLSGTPSDFYWEHVLFEFDFGRNSNAQPFPILASVDSSWTSAFIQRGCAKVHVVLRADSGWTAVFPSGQIPNIQFLVTGKKLIDPRIETQWQASVPYSEFQWILDAGGHIWVQTNASGTSGSARPAFESVGGIFPATLSDGTLSWTSNGYSIAQAEQGADGDPQGHLVGSSLVNDGWGPGTGYPQGYIIEAPLGYLQMQTASGGTVGSTEPNFSITLGGTTADGSQAWVCLGRSRHAINPSNSALAVYDYLQDTDAGLGVDPTTIDPTSVIAAANVCEEQELIIWNADGTQVFENLYSCNGMFDHSSNRGNVVTSLCGSMAGWVVQPGDFWRIFAGTYVTPVITLTDDDLAGPIKGDFRISKREVANTMRGTFVPAFLPTNPGGALSLTQVPGTWQSQSFPEYQANGLAGKPDYLDSEDGGQIISQEMQLDFTTSLWTAQRLAKIALMQLRFPQTLTLHCKMTAFQLEGGDTFGFIHTRWGIHGGVFLASQSSITFDNDGGKNPAPTMAIDIVGRQTDPAVYQYGAPSGPGDYGEYSPYGVTGVMSGVE